MKKTICSLMAMIMTVGMFGFSGVSVKASEAQSTIITIRGDQDFTLVNRTGVEIYAVYVSPHNEDSWGEDVLGRDTLPNGDSVDITFSRKETAKYWDIRIEDKDENYIEWDRFNLLEISTIKLFYKNGRATAEYN